MLCLSQMYSNITELSNNLCKMNTLKPRIDGQTTLGLMLLFVGGGWWCGRGQRNIGKRKFFVLYSQYTRKVKTSKRGSGDMTVPLGSISFSARAHTVNCTYLDRELTSCRDGRPVYYVQCCIYLIVRERREHLVMLACPELCTCKWFRTYHHTMASFLKAHRHTISSSCLVAGLVYLMVRTVSEKEYGIDLQSLGCSTDLPDVAEVQRLISHVLRAQTHCSRQCIYGMPNGTLFC